MMELRSGGFSLTDLRLAGFSAEALDGVGGARGRGRKRGEA